MITETIVWHQPGEQMPDEDTTVLVHAPESDEPVWPGYCSAGHWYWADGSDVQQHVKAWAHLPTGGGMQ